MVIDTSAVVAIILRELEARAFAEAMLRAKSRLMSAATLVEATLVLEGARVGATSAELDRFVRVGDVEIVSVNLEQAEVARSAWRRFGKGRHPAGLNYGDCFAYALAKVTSEPLLFKGDDFRQTDITPAI